MARTKKVRIHKGVIKMACEGYRGKECHGTVREFEEVMGGNTLSQEETEEARLSETGLQEETAEIRETES